MGAETGLKNPTFAVLAMKDPGDPGNPGTPLQRLQIVKGWIDATGEAKEETFDVAGNANNGAAVDLDTCTPTGPGFDTLCAAWKDPEFDPSQRAFYYARVLENPTCRWSQRVCNANGIECSIPGSVPAAFTACCDTTCQGGPNKYQACTVATQGTDCPESECVASVPKTLQERSWASPIWYRPEGLRQLNAAIAFGATPGTDVLRLRAKLGAGRHDPQTEDIRLMVRDDDDILDLTIPAGTLINGQVKDLGVIKLARFVQSRSLGRAIFVLRTIPSNFAQSRLWVRGPTKLGTR
jgi:hypothetical protein